MTDYSILQKYKTASTNKYCGEENCTDTDSRHDCVYAKSDRETYLKPCPPGYKFDAWDDGAMCALDRWGRRCKRDPTSEYWEGEYATRAKASNPNKAIMEQAFKCCSNGVTATKDNVEKCGSLYSGADNTFTPECNRLFKRYCLAGENINTDLCKKKIMDYPEFQARLASICPSKIGSTKWEDVCSCYYGFDHYDSIAKQIESRWVGPENGMPRNPQCVNPRCKSSPYRNKADDDRCGTVSFTQCVNEIELDASGSKINNITFNQDSACNNLYRTTDNTAGKAAAGAKPAKPANKGPTKQNTTAIIFTIVCIILAVLTGGAYVYYRNKKDPENESNDTTDVNISPLEQSGALGGTFIPLYSM